MKSKTCALLQQYLAADVAWVILGMLTPIDVHSKTPEEQFKGYCELGFYEKARQILDNNSIGVGGGLAITCQLGFVDLVRIILNKMDAKMNVVMEPAMRNGFDELVQTVKDYSNDYKTHGFYQACAHGQFDVVAMLIDHGVAHDRKSITKGIQLAGMNGNIRIQNYLTGN